jgi:hypothetical protein
VGTKDDAISYLRARIALLTQRQEEILAEIENLEVTILHLESSGESDLSDSADSGSRVRADEFRLNRFKGRSLVKVVEERFSYTGGIGLLTVDQLVKDIYVPLKTHEQNRVCKASIAATVHKLKTAGKVEQVEPGSYRFLPPSPEGDVK